MSTRRQFLRTAALGAVAASTLPRLLRAEPAGSAPGLPASAGPAPAGLVDLHSHWFSPASVEILSKRTTGPKFTVNAKGEKFLSRPGSEIPGGGKFPLGSQWFDLDARIRHLDAEGVTHQLVSWPTTLGVDAAITAAEARELWGAYNTELGAAVQKYSSHLSGVAALATADPEWSAAELARAHDQLGLIGGVLPANVFATLEGAKRLEPVFAAAQKYRSHLYLHTGGGSPTIPGQPDWKHADTPGPRGSLDNIYNFAAATITLAYSGFLDAYPDVTVQIAQLGGSGGIALVEELARTAAPRSKEPTAAKFRQIYLDTGAGGRGPEAIALAVRVFGADRIVFGTDYAPQASVAPVIANIVQSSLTAFQRRAVFTDTPRALLASKGVKLPSLA